MEAYNKTVAILGSTGSVGCQTLDVVRELGLRVSLLAGHRNAEVLARQIAEFSPEKAICADRETARTIEGMCDLGCTSLLYGEDALDGALLDSPAYFTVHAIAGLAGLRSALTASRTGTRICMANKEALICAGELIFDNLRRFGGELVPVDSEHSAIFQCLAENRTAVTHAGTDGDNSAVDCGGVTPPRNVRRLILTASGGPFFGWTRRELELVTPEMALAHPTWKMGPKITIDSATLMNKGFEIVEAIRLFGVPSDQIDVVVHRQSIIHSMVEYTDNTVIAQLQAPDMHSAIRYAFTYPGRAQVSTAPLDFASIGSLTFDSPDSEVFPLLDAGRAAYEMGGTAPCALIGADEEAVGAFLRGDLGFCQIADVTLEALEMVKTDPVSEQSLREADAQGRALARECINKQKNLVRK